MRVSISLPDDMMKKIDSNAKKLSLSRSAYIAMVLTKAIQQDEVVAALPDMLAFVRQYQELGMSLKSKDLDSDDEEKK